MKKIMLTLALPAAVIMLCGSCVHLETAARSNYFVEGIARPGATYDDNLILPGTAGWGHSACTNYCIQEFGAGTTHIPLPPSAGEYYDGNYCGYCRVARNLSHVKHIGSANTENECGVMAGQAGYLEYFYNPRTSGCAAEGKYEYIGFAETRKECINMVKQTKYPKAIWPSDTKKCYGASQ